MEPVRLTFFPQDRLLATIVGCFVAGLVCWSPTALPLCFKLLTRKKGLCEHDHWTGLLEQLLTQFNSH